MEVFFSIPRRARQQEEQLENQRLAQEKAQKEGPGAKRYGDTMGDGDTISGFVESMIWHDVADCCPLIVM